MESKWLWKAIMIPACGILILGIIGVVYPDTYIDFYLQQAANTSLEALSTTQPEITLLLDVIFRANGLGMTMSGILAIFIILFAFRKGKKWSVPALAIATNFLKFQKSELLALILFPQPHLIREALGEKYLMVLSLIQILPAYAAAHHSQPLLQ